MPTVPNAVTRAGQELDLLIQGSPVRLDPESQNSA